MKGFPARAMSPVVGIALMVVIVVLLCITTTVMVLGFTDHLVKPAPMFSQTGHVEAEVTNGTISNQSLSFQHVAGDDVQADNLKIRVSTGTKQFVSPVNRTADLADGTWSAGEVLSLDLNTTDVCTGSNTLDVELVYQSSRSSYVVGKQQFPVTKGGFTIKDGSVVPVTEYTATTTVVGTGLTYGSPGPNIPIFLTFQIGSSTHQPWAGNVNNPNNPRSHTFVNQPAGAPISVGATRAAYGYLDEKTRWSNGSSTWVRVLRDGDTPPNIQGYGGQAGLTSYVDPYVDGGTGEIDLADNQAIYLFELGTSPTGAAADYQDVVVLVSLQTQAQTVGTYTTPQGNTGLVCPTNP